MRAPTTTRAAVAFAAIIAAMLSILALAGSASAVTLKGEWAPFNRCPVDDPSMLATNIFEETVSVCLAVDSPKGSIKIGNLSAVTGPSNTQMGVLGSGGGAQFSPVNPPTGAISATPLVIPGGLVGLVCPKGADFKGDICRSAGKRAPRLNVVTSTLESAGTPSNFAIFAALEPGQRIVTLPAKLHLQNPLLGPKCYIGSNEHPILLQPATVVPPEGSIVLFGADGTVSEGEEGLIFDAVFSHTSQADTTFAVGKAKGCGVNSYLDAAINHTLGLPSPAGNNSMTLEEVTSSLIGLNVPTQTDGKDLSAYWHGAVTG